MARILLVEDDPDMSQLVVEILSTNHHIVEPVFEGEEGLERLTYYHYDLAILDWVLPGLSGLLLCQTYRMNGGQVPILFLTAQSNVINKVKALDAGADDYLCKPYNHSELLARVKALLRRPPGYIERVIEASGISLDLDACTVTMDGDKVQMTPSEFALLELFMKNQGRVYSSDELLARVFKTESEATAEAVRQRVLRLRKKISSVAKESPIKTVKGLGYKFES